MKKNLKLKLAIIIGTLLVFLVGMFYGTPDNWGKSHDAIKKGGLKAGLLNNIHLGLDLKGGTHLILQVMVDEAVSSETDRIAENLKQNLAGKGITIGSIQKPKPEQIVLQNIPVDRQSEVRNTIADQYPTYDISSNADNDLVVSMRPSEVAALKDRTVKRAIETIRGRVDALGVSEPVIQEHGLGENQILVQLPGVDDPSRVRQIMQETGMLEIRQEFAGPFATEQEAQADATSRPDAVVLPGQLLKNGSSGTPEFYVVARAAVVSGTDIRSATPTTSQASGTDVVQFTLTADAGRRFGQFTAANIGNSLAVVLNGGDGLKVRSVANIRDEIRDSGVIEGLRRQEAEDLSKLLESGALPASIRYLEDRTVGASLGAESIKQGVTAAVVGMTLVIIFMLIYYHGAGINADLGLILNLVILLGFLGFSGAVLTLPGIAGVILTIGMGVDSNVLIFERIREELRAGKTPGAAVDQGFAHAWITIIDTHITTIVSALILFVFGSGPVRGFAVTLAFGLFANLFTAVFVSRAIFDWNVSRHKHGEGLSIGGHVTGARAA
jgi:preprotein translocase subunit SecD